MLDELCNSAGVLEIQPLCLASLGIGKALVGQRDLQAFVQESELAETLGQRVKVVFRGGENFFVGKKMYFGPAFFCCPGFLQLGLRIALGVSLLPHVPVAPDFQIQLMAKRVDAGNTNAVESA